MKKQLLTVSALCLLAACAGFKPDYVKTDGSEKSVPAWTHQSKAHKIDSSSEAKKNRYFVADAQNVNQRLCLKAAETRATQKIASEIAQEIMGAFEESSASQNDDANSRMKDTLQQNIQDYTAYKCDVVVKITKAALADALEMYTAKTMRTLKGEDKAAMSQAVDNYVADLRAEN